MAEVWKAETAMHQPIAVKVLLPKYCSDPDVVNRFRAEAEVMAKLRHPNIRQVYGFDESAGQPRILMEYLEGDDLASRMTRGERFSQEQLCYWWNQLAEALNFTHSHGVVHRDIKPSNIFVTTKGEVKLLDFGIAKIKDSIVSTQTGVTLGTLMYMSPEQVRDSKHIDYRTDLYSLAVTFVHLLSGCPPYDANTTDDFEIRTKIVTHPLDMKRVPLPWRGFLLPYLAKRPAERPPLTSFSFSDRTISSPTRYLPRKPRVWPWIVAVLLTLLVAVILVAVFLNKENHSQEESVAAGPGIDEYNPITIGNQVWMTKNMRNKCDANGNLLAEGSDYFPTESEEYGLLYSWDAAMKVCPEGWHLPSEREWEILTEYVSSQPRFQYDNDTKKIAKSLATTTAWKWDKNGGTVGNDPQSNNATGFSALPASCYDPRHPDAVVNSKERADFWSATTKEDDYARARFYYLDYNCSRIEKEYFRKEAGLSVRCVKD